jgi:predicted RND superfamily exporter protein
MFDRFVRAVAYRPGWVLAINAAVSLFFAAQLVDVRALELRLHIQTEIEKILPAGGEYLEFYGHFRDLFGSYEMVFVGVAGADTFTPEGLRLLQRLTQRFEEIDGVRRVLSLSNAPGIRSEEDGVRIATAFDEAPEDAEELARIRSRILGDPMLAGNLVSSDGQATALLVYPEEMSEREFRRRGIDQEIERVARDEVGDRARVLMAGNPPLKAATGRILLRDVVLLLPLSFAFMALIAFGSFRSARGVAVPLLSIGVAQLWTAGTMVMVDRSLNLVTFIVPILINAVGFAYSVHVVSEHDEALREGNVRGDAAYVAVKRVAFPVFLTALTTAAGFLSLCLSRLPAIREFGAFCVVGVLCSLIAGLTLAPAVLSLTGRRAHASSRPSVE